MENCSFNLGGSDGACLLSTCSSVQAMRSDGGWYSLVLLSSGLAAWGESPRESAELSFHIHMRKLVLFFS